MTRRKRIAGTNGIALCDTAAGLQPVVRIAGQAEIVDALAYMGIAVLKPVLDAVVGLPQNRRPEARERPLRSGRGGVDLIRRAALRQDQPAFREDEALPQRTPAPARSPANSSSKTPGANGDPAAGDGRNG